MMFERQSDGYRRGLTLGLTMAEIFVLIVFMLLLMLLALSAFNAKNKTELEKYQKAAAELEDGIRDAGKSAASMRDSIIAAQKEIEDMTDEIGSLTGELGTARKEVEDLTDSLGKEKQEKERLRRELDQLHAESKGIDPPCWYQVVDRQGKRYERPYYLMDIAVHSGRLRVALRPSRPGRAIDERGKSASTTYAEEYARLPLSPFQNAGDMSLAEFAEVA
ncbi:MAG: hypothetical protein MPL62_10720, partial [Alphaproteobacteria bacterium]|nr:hypothetical protein [Alphaproteobacteria bacterium]